MFGKLLKYDFRSMLKQFAFIWPAALVLAVVNRFTLSGLDSTSATGETVAAIAMFVFVSIMIAMFVIAVIFTVQRFYKGLLGDEGYLMHTLPVRPWALIASKLVCAVVLTVISIVIAIVSILVIVSPVVDIREIFHVLRWFWEALRGNTNVINAFLVILEFLLLLLVGMAQSYLMLYLAMAIGHLFNKNRAAMSVAAYIGIHVVVSMLPSSINNIFGDMLGDFLSDLFWGKSGYPVWQSLHMSLWFSILFVGIGGAVYFFLTEYILRRRLNLE